MSEDEPRHKTFLRRFIAIDITLLKQFIGPGAITPYGSYIASLIFP